jgi:hypothetical protein
MIHFTNHKNSKFGTTFARKNFFLKKIPQARINENATSAILRIQEKGIDFQGEGMLEAIPADFLR